MVPLFPTITTEDGVHSNPRPLSIQKLVPNQASATHNHFKVSHILFILFFIYFIYSYEYQQVIITPTATENR